MAQRVLFLCTHNSARSQMAEGLLRHLSRGTVEAYSAGTEATRVQPLAIQVMQEIGIDIAHQTSKTLDRYLNEHFDAVVTVCDNANEHCPIFPNADRRLHWSIPDPTISLDEDQLDAFRHARDTAMGRIEQELLPNLHQPSPR